MRRTTVVFAIWLCLCLRALASDDVSLVAFGDWGINSADQRAVASVLAGYVKKDSRKPDAVLLLGDNFYGPMPDGVRDKRWQTEFELMYPNADLPMPFYALLGNHDYEGEGVGEKSAAELEYAARNTSSRWKMPARWYRIDFPEEKPLVTVLCIDTDANPLGPKRWAEQKAWLAAQLASAGRGQWTVVAGHHPLFSNGQHGDGTGMIAELAPLLIRNGVQFYLCGHDHDLQHIELDGWPTSFLVSGGGGAPIRPIQDKKAEREPFARSSFGFLAMRFSKDKAEGAFVGTSMDVLYSFEKDMAGRVQIRQTTDGGAAPTSR
jgi:3',5'-cyclic AMP phosphodiesterase CpdA